MYIFNLLVLCTYKEFALTWIKLYLRFRVCFSHFLFFWRFSDFENEESCSPTLLFVECINSIIFLIYWHISRKNQGIETYWNRVQRQRSQIFDCLNPRQNIKINIKIKAFKVIPVKFRFWGLPQYWSIHFRWVIIVCDFTILLEKPV